MNKWLYKHRGITLASISISITEKRGGGGALSISPPQVQKPENKIVGLAKNLIRQIREKTGI